MWKVARAYPYIVRANGAQAAIRIEDPVHPLLLAFKTDGELDPGQGQFQVLRANDYRHQRQRGIQPFAGQCNLQSGNAGRGQCGSAPSEAVRLRVILGDYVGRRDVFSRGNQNAAVQCSETALGDEFGQCDLRRECRCW